MTANQIVVMAQMNLRPAQPVIAPSASSSVRTATVPILASSVTATQTALMVQMRALLSAVRQFIKIKLIILNCISVGHQIGS